MTSLVVLLPRPYNLQSLEEQAPVKPLMIGDLAAATGTKVNTIRFYEDIGLMPKAARTESGRRTYGQPDLLRLAFIRHARAMGFSTDEIRSLLELASHPELDCADAAGIAQCHLHKVDRRIASLKRLRAELRKIASSCDGGPVVNCRVSEAIAEAGAA